MPISYPQPAAANLPETFLPGVVSGADIDFNAAFSADGRSFYFSRKSGKQARLMVSQYVSGRWDQPQPLPFSTGQFADADPAFSPEGKLYFISTRPLAAGDTTTDYNIWFASPNSDGTWAAPQPLATVNSDADEYYISFAANGNMYFASSRPGGFGEEDIYISKWHQGHYAAPINLGPAVNTAHSEYDPFVSADEKLLIFTSSGRVEGIGGADLYAIKLTGSAQRQTAQNLGPLINTTARDYCPYISPDGKYFFFSTAGDVKWMEFSAVQRVIK
nr:hypothetical protein [uncultured Mucilaginibacter sp.]